VQAVKYHSTVTVTPTIENLGRSENGKMKIIKQQKRKEEKKRKKKEVGRADSEGAYQLNSLTR
jgi:hypothetical protein